MEKSLMLARILRRAGVFRPSIGLDEAREAARKACVARGLKWDPPIKGRLTIRGYRFWTNADSIGGNVIVWVSQKTGNVKEVVSTPR
jgi:hypothetical protein